MCWFIEYWRFCEINNVNYKILSYSYFNPIYLFSMPIHSYLIVVTCLRTSDLNSKIRKHCLNTRSHNAGYEGYCIPNTNRSSKNWYKLWIFLYTLFVYLLVNHLPWPLAKWMQYRLQPLRKYKLMCSKQIVASSIHWHLLYTKPYEGIRLVLCHMASILALIVEVARPRFRRKP